MKKFKVIITVIMIIAAVCGMSGCSFFSTVSFDPEETGIFIKKNGHVTGAEITSFDNSMFETPRYDEGELKVFVENAVLVYNSAAGYTQVRQSDVESKETVLPVSIEKCEVADKKATVILEYASASDYLNFNGTAYLVPIKNLIIGTVADGNNSGLAYAGMLDKDGAAAAAEDISAKAKYSLAAVTGDSLVKVEGTIRYYSSTLTLVDEHTVRSSGDTVNYIVFK